MPRPGEDFGIISAECVLSGLGHGQALRREYLLSSEALCLELEAEEGWGTDHCVSIQEGHGRGPKRRDQDYMIQDFAGVTHIPLRNPHSCDRSMLESPMFPDGVRSALRQQAPAHEDPPWLLQAPEVATDMKMLPIILPDALHGASFVEAIDHGPRIWEQATMVQQQLQPEGRRPHSLTFADIEASKNSGRQRPDLRSWGADAIMAGVMPSPTPESAMMVGARHMPWGPAMYGPPQCWPQGPTYSAGPLQSCPQGFAHGAAMMGPHGPVPQMAMPGMQSWPQPFVEPQPFAGFGCGDDPRSRAPQAMVPGPLPCVGLVASEYGMAARISPEVASSLASQLGGVSGRIEQTGNPNAGYW